MNPYPICLASNNENKIKEIRALAPPHLALMSLHAVGCFEELAETSDTFEGNAYQKAVYLARQYQVNSLADDSGLVVPALGGAPGVFSARFAGPDRNDAKNLQKLLDDMAYQTDRRAYFVCVLCLIFEGLTHFFRGEVHGTLAEAPRGHRGFGYDPIFIPKGFSSTFAEMLPEEKNAISHRGKALQALAIHFNRML